MSTYTEIGGLAFESPNGGRIAISPDAEVAVPGLLMPTPEGMAFGPLEFQTPAGETLGISRLKYLPPPESLLERIADSLPLNTTHSASLTAASLTASAATAASPDMEIGRVTRRDLLKAGAVALGLTGSSVGVTRAAEKPAHSIVEIELAQNPGGVRLRIADVIKDTLPPGQKYYVTADGNHQSTFTPTSDPGDVEAGAAGLIQVKTEATADTLEYVSALIHRDTVTYQWTLPHTASDYSSGSRTTLTDQRLAVDPLQDAGPNATVLSIGETSIPHREEDSNADVGMYYLSDGDLVYVAGLAPPDSDTVVFKGNVGMSTEALDDTSRITDTIPRP